MKVEFKGKLVKKDDAKTVGGGHRVREFWASEPASEGKPENILKFKLFTSAKGPSRYKAGVDDIDRIPDGSEIAFAFEPTGRKWTNREGVEVLFVELAVASKIVSMRKAEDVPPPAQPDGVSEEEMPF